MGFAEFDEDYPWDALIPYRRRASQHPGGTVDLSIGTPIDPTPSAVQEALAAASGAPGYPLTAGTPALRAAIARWFLRRRGVEIAPEATLPTIGSKELVGLLPSLLGLGAGDVVVHPAVAYPTYRVGALLAGAQALASDDVDEWSANSAVKLVWLNSPSNPTGRVMPDAEIARAIAAARQLGAVVVGDECYAELDWRAGGSTTTSVLSAEVCGDSHEGVLAAYSLSKQSNVAGYRAAFVAGDRAIVDRLLRIRKHLGMIVPEPIQAAMTAALEDDAHVTAQRELYRGRRQKLLAAVREAGFELHGSEAGLYLWARRPEDEDCWATIGWLADRGIVAGPGEFYGESARRWVRLSVTASDEDISTAAARIIER
ncbi:succinyldiaminopimelate transaminase [Rarobacter faecitabidus]|uniref:Aminotransferase n=1 Tax=Rarobacter faecitabidus TaxID=13243 RepID=A0A542ZUP8_RARFA|nr:succinyldiaminopimelate transaminase [Rarobacter faecitabidus]TQL64041.1 succinyldiaminopimelate aminotransferase [Rarobacter faecitabidus]